MTDMSPQEPKRPPHTNPLPPDTPRPVPPQPPMTDPPLPDEHDPIEPQPVELQRRVIPREISERSNRSGWRLRWQCV
jgi:hypothetical protein